MSLGLKTTPLEALQIRRDEMTPLDRLLAMKRPFLNAGGLETQQIYQNPQSGRTTRRRHGIGMSLNLFDSAPVLSSK